MVPDKVFSLEPEDSGITLFFMQQKLTTKNEDLGKNFFGLFLWTDFCIILINY